MTAAMECEPCAERAFWDLSSAVRKKNDGWGISSDYCSYFGVVCNAAGEVVRIKLAQDLLTGALTTDIFKLVSLQELNLELNEFSFLFKGIEQATSLSKLVLSGTGLDSVAGVEKARNLTELHLTNNNLETFPSEIYSLSRLRKLVLNFNQIAGPIPAASLSLSNLEALYLFHNRCQLPAALGSLVKLSALALSENNFSGSLPVQPWVRSSSLAHWRCRRTIFRGRFLCN